MITNIDARPCVHPLTHAQSASSVAWTLLIASAAALCACASAPEAQLELSDARLATTADAREGALEEQLAALDVERLQLALPAPELRQSPDQPGYWFARAVAYAPGVRAALAEWRAARAAVASAGAPEPALLEVDDHSFESDEPAVELVLMFDVLGHLGIGPSAAERAAGTASERLALVQLERAAFEAWLAVERARVGLAASRARLAVYDTLNVELQQDLARYAVLRAHGRIGEAEALAAEATFEELERRRSLAREATLMARLALGLAAGLAEDHTALEAVGAGDMRSFETLAAALPHGPATDAELERHPRVRELRRRFELAEADVRRAAALAWPMIGLGPQFTRAEGFGVDDLAIGGMLQFSLPFPSRWRGALESAVERRAGIVAAFEDELLALELRAAEAHARAAEIRARADGSSRALAGAADQGWRAARASFRVGRVEPRMWRDDLRMQLEGSVLPIDEVELVALATLDEIEARGPHASPFAATPPTSAVDASVEREVQP
jgi:hypothetical protein